MLGTGKLTKDRKNHSDFDLTKSVSEILILFFLEREFDMQRSHETVLDSQVARFVRTDRPGRRTKQRHRPSVRGVLLDDDDLPHVVFLTAFYLELVHFLSTKSAKCD